MPGACDQEIRWKLEGTAKDRSESWIASQEVWWQTSPREPVDPGNWLAEAWMDSSIALHPKHLVRLNTFAVGVLVPWTFFGNSELFITIVLLVVFLSHVRDNIRVPC